MRMYRDAHARGTNHSAAVMEHDLAVLQRHFQFIRDDEADLARGESDWEVRMSVRYYRKLFREYALADLSRYREGKVGLRWRTEMEVVAGKGQFTCGNKVCDERHGLHSYELLFAYVEHGDTKRCLVKVRVCESCARKLFYRKLKETEKLNKKQNKKNKKKETRWSRRQEGGEDEEEDDGESDDEQRHRKRKRSRSGAGEEEGVRLEKRKKTTHADSIHARCAAINEAETQRLRRANDDESGRSADDKETRELAQLLL
jgi:protein FRA10AC1